MPGLDLPGIMSSHRPFLKLTLGASEKETDFADFAGHESGEGVGKCAKECPWRFSDSITFSATAEELVGPGLKVKMYTRQDVTCWPVQFQMQPVQAAEGLVDLKTRVLPACDRQVDGLGVDFGTRAFMSP